MPFCNEKQRWWGPREFQLWCVLMMNIYGMGHTGSYWKITKKEVSLSVNSTCWSLFENLGHTLGIVTLVISISIQRGEDFRRAPGLGSGPLLKVIASIVSSDLLCKGDLALSLNQLYSMYSASQATPNLLEKICYTQSQVLTYLLTTWEHLYKSEGCWVVAL